MSEVAGPVPLSYPRSSGDRREEETDVGESRAIGRSEAGPVTVQSLREDLAVLGVERGSVLLVHSSMSSLGWVCGGVQAVVRALREALGPEGTLVMPAHSAELSEPSYWQDPPVPESWWPLIRAQMPAFDPAATATRGMGVVAESFRSLPGVVRSNHPTASFAAQGPLAHEVCATHQLEDGLGEGSPLAAIHRLGGHVLLLGVRHESNTSLHLAERRAFGAAQITIKTGAPLMERGQRVWKTFEEPDVDSDDFAALGEHLESRRGLVTKGLVGNAVARLMRQADVVDAAVPWLIEHRNADGTCPT